MVQICSLFNSRGETIHIQLELTGFIGEGSENMTMQQLKHKTLEFEYYCKWSYPIVTVEMAQRDWEY